MNPLRIVLVSLAGLLASSSFAADLPHMTQLLEKVWQSGYREGRCGDNIEGLVRQGIKQGLDLNEAEVVMITNAGSSVFGLVNAERTRSSPPLKKTLEMNWGHHVILVFEGHVFDFDFMLEPTVLPVREYFEQMFLDEIQKPTSDFHRVGRATKLRDYQVTIYPAREVLKRPRDLSRKQEFRLSEFLQSR